MVRQKIHFAGLFSDQFAKGRGSQIDGAGIWLRHSSVETAKTPVSLLGTLSPNHP